VRIYRERLLFCRSSVRSLRRSLSPRRFGAVGFGSWWASAFFGQPLVPCSFGPLGSIPFMLMVFAFPLMMLFPRACKRFVSLVLPFVACLPIGSSAVSFVSWFVVEVVGLHSCPVRMPFWLVTAVFFLGVHCQPTSPFPDEVIVGSLFGFLPAFVLGYEVLIFVVLRSVSHRFQEEVLLSKNGRRCSRFFWLWVSRF